MTSNYGDYTVSNTFAACEVLCILTCWNHLLSVIVLCNYAQVYYEIDLASWNVSVAMLFIYYLFYLICLCMVIIKTGQKFNDCIHIYSDKV